MNHWCGSGNVSTDVQIRYTTSGTPVAKFNLAIRDTFKKDAATTFIQVNVWDKLAEACVNNVYTGDKIVVEGKLKSTTYDSKKYPGAKITQHYIEAYHVEFDPRNIGKKPSENEYTDDIPFSSESSAVASVPDIENSSSADDGGQAGAKQDEASIFGGHEVQEEIPF